MTENIFTLHNKSICNIMKDDIFIYPSLVKNSNLPNECPFKRKIYKLNNYMINLKIRTSYMISGTFKVIISLEKNNRILTKMYGIVQVNKIM